MKMKSGILRQDEGYDILHNGVPRTFRDVQQVAIAAAQFAKSRHPEDIIHIVDRATGTKQQVLPDGRLA